MQKNSVFLRTVYITSTILLCLFLGIYGIFSAYKSIRQIAFGEYRNAVEIKEDEIKILDFELN